MKNWKKIALIAGGVIILLAIVGFTVEQSRKGVVTVQTGKVIREDLTSVVTASGEIKPKVQVNIGSNAFAKITHLSMKNWKKIALIAGGVIILLAIVGFTVEQSRKGVVTVQTGKAN